MSHLPAKANEPTYEPGEDLGPQVGEWYWVADGKRGKQLACVTHVGSNYAQLDSPFQRTWRVHFEDWIKTCTKADTADQYIASQIRDAQDEVHRLLGEVRALTTSLGVGPQLQLGDGSETRALAKIGLGQDVKDYKRALVVAKTDQLPKLFSKIREANERLATWMTAPTIPLKAQAKGLDRTIKQIDGRILNVELYSGIVEECIEVAGGEPAPMDAPIYLFQRRHYMDEECLARYQTGGMEFKDIEAFDAWLAKPENRDRILPHPRCVVAFQVRRRTKEREAVNLRDFFKFMEMERWDKATFLYLRNGDQLWRLSTEIEFKAQLFPDEDTSIFGKGEPMYARMFTDRVETIITEGDMNERIAAYEAGKACHEAEIAAWKAKGSPAKEQPAYYFGSDPRGLFVRYSPDNVDYDNVTRHIQEAIEHHNRIALVLQGLLDRSLVFHPHPPWRLWEPTEFQRAVVLVRDDSRALTTGAAPDFEAYRRKLNASLKVGSVTVGQFKAWLRAMTEKENERRARDWRSRYHYREFEEYHPYGNPGPGILARVGRFQKRAERCTYVWNRERQVRKYWKDESDEVRATFTCDTDLVLNVDAYTPGDFHLFFDDPRTRADYLQWAPLLLEAEEYRAGNRKVKP